MVDANGVGVFVVKEGAGMAVGAATLITSVQRQMKENKREETKGEKLNVSSA